jgi:predicted N-acetyltransferase YhbS
LRAHALDNEGKASRTFVVTLAEGGVIVAYYTLAAGSVILREIPRRQRQGLPNPVPVMVLGRLAVDCNHHGRGLGKALLRQAMQRTLTVSREAGVRALIIHAIDDEAVNFYARYGFQHFPAGTRTMMMMIETMAGAL